MVAALPAYGHLYPLLPLAHALAEQGDDVTVLTGEGVTAGLTLPVAAEAPPWTSTAAYGRAMALLAEEPEPDPSRMVTAMFVDATAPGVIETARPALTRLAPDVVVADCYDVGTLVAARLLDLPTVLVGITRMGDYGNRIVARAAELYADQLASHGRHGAAGLADLKVEPFPAFLLDPADVSPWPELAVRPDQWSPPGPAWNGSSARPRAYVTLGTVFSSAELLRAAAVGVAAAGYDVLVALGPAVQRADLGDLPDSVRAEEFVDQAAALDGADVVVHHGGSGTLLGALARDLPQVLVPRGADQFWNAEQMAAEGAAVVLSADDAAAGLADAVARAGEPDGPVRANATRLGRIVRSRPTPAEVARQISDSPLLR